MKNQDTGHLFLNDEHELPESRVVIEKGVAWEYRNTEEEEEESIQTTGPLKYGVVLMVSPSACEAQSVHAVSNTNQNYQHPAVSCPSGPFSWRLKGDGVL